MSAKLKLDRAKCAQPRSITGRRHGVNAVSIKFLRGTPAPAAGMQTTGAISDKTSAALARINEPRPNLDAEP